MHRLLSIPSGDLLALSDTLATLSHFVQFQGFTPHFKGRQQIRKNNSIICFSHENWDGIWRRRRHLLLELSKVYKILFVEPPVTLADPITHREKWFDWIKGERRIRKINNNLYIYTLFVPFCLKLVYAWRFLKDVNYFVSSILLKRIVKKLDLKNLLLWVPKPHWLEWGNILSSFERKLLIYDCCDEYSAYPGVSKKIIQKTKDSEIEILKKSDIVFVVSKKLMINKKKFSKNVYLVRNGVDTKNFRVKSDSGNNPLLKIPHPIIGYIGNLALLDLNLVKYIAKSKPCWSIALIGPANIDTSQLAGINNIWLLGQKPYWKLPNFIVHFDVCIMPFVVDELMENADTLKLYEYLVLGKPVVSVNIQQARDFQDVVKVARSPKEFVNCIIKALNEDEPIRVQKRLKFAKQNSWENRAQLVMEIIAKHIGECKSSLS